MGSLRRPIGPLPSSIYWRRRVVLLSLFVVAGLLVAWFMTSGGDTHNSSHGSDDGRHPAPSITPGPSGSGPAISQHPGGRDKDDGGKSGGGGAADGGSGDGGGASGSGGSGGGAGGGGTGGGSEGDAQVPAGSSLPGCTRESVHLTVASHPRSYGPGEHPRIQLTAKNVSGTACKIDLGPRHAVVTITRTDGDERMWSSNDCTGDSSSLFLRVPPGDSITHTLVWDRTASAPDCATPPSTSVSAGTYLVEAETPGFPKTQSSFVLDKD